MSVFCGHCKERMWSPEDHAEHGSEWRCAQREIARLKSELQEAKQDERIAQLTADLDAARNDNRFLLSEQERRNIAWCQLQDERDALRLEVGAATEPLVMRDDECYDLREELMHVLGAFDTTPRGSMYVGRIKITDYERAEKVASEATNSWNQTCYTCGHVALCHVGKLTECVDLISREPDVYCDCDRFIPDRRENDLRS